MVAALADQPQAPDTVDKLLQVYKGESCQQQRRFSSCKHLSLVSFVNSFQFFSTVKVRILVPLRNWYHCLSFSLRFAVFTDCGTFTLFCFLFSFFLFLSVCVCVCVHSHILEVLWFLSYELPGTRQNGVSPRPYRQDWQTHFLTEMIQRVCH